MRDLLTAQVIQKGEIDDLLNVTREQTRHLELEREQRREVDAAFDKRVQDLVSSIGGLIERIPPQESAPTETWHATK